MYLMKGAAHMYIAIGIAGALIVLDGANMAAINIRVMGRHLRIHGVVVPINGMSRTRGNAKPPAGGSSGSGGGASLPGSSSSAAVSSMAGGDAMQGLRTAVRHTATVRPGDDDELLGS